MESTITPEEIEKMKAFLKEHPVDPQYDGLLDGDIPTEQAHALIYESLLKQLGELPEEQPSTKPRCEPHRGFFMPTFGCMRPGRAIFIPFCPDAAGLTGPHRR